MNPTLLLPPTAVAQMDELAIWIRASQNKINPLVCSVLKHDAQLQMSVIETCNEWGTTLERLKQSKKGELYKNMRAAYALNVRMKPTKDENKMQCTKREMGIHLKGTAVTRTTIHQKQAGTLMRLRSILRHGHTTEHKTCAFCNNGKQHTVTHVIAECKYHTTTTIRTEMSKNVTDKVLNYITNLTAIKLAAITGGTPPEELNLMERTQTCEMAIALFDTSPLFNQEQ